MSRTNLTKTVKELWRTKSKGRYYAHRGPIDWASFRFSKYPYAVAICLDDVPLFMNEKGHFEAVLTLEVFTRLEKDTSEIHDGLMDEIHTHIREVLMELRVAVNEAGDAVIFRLHEQSATAVEVHDATLGVQGIIASTKIDF